MFQQLLALFSSEFINDNWGSGGQHLGNAVIEHFVSETDLLRPFRYSHPLSDRRAMYPYVENEERLERSWNEDDSEDVLIMTYQCEDGTEMRQLTKKSMLRGQEPQVQIPRSMHPQAQCKPSVASRVPVSSRASRSASKGPPRIFKFESRNPYWERTRRKLASFECSECGYGSDSMPHHSPGGILSVGRESKPAYMVPAAVNQLSRLKMDVLHVLCDFLPDESLRALSNAYRPFDAFLRRTNVLRRRQVRCFYLSTPFEDCTKPEGAPEPASSEVMGIGISLEGAKLSCPTLLDGFLSEAAFQKCGVRRSIRKKEFGFFLPLALNYRHFQQIKPRVLDCLKTLSAEVALSEPYRREHGFGSRSHRPTAARGPGYVRGATPAMNTRSAVQADVDSVNVLYKFLNDAVGTYMRTCEAILDAPPAALRRRGDMGGNSQSHPQDEESYSTSLMHAAEMFLPVYWQIMHLLLCLCRDNPAILRAAHTRVRQFIDSPDKRSKEYEPELGELLVVAALVFACQDEGLLPSKEPIESAPDPPPRQSQRLQRTPGSRTNNLLRTPNKRRGASVAPSLAGSSASQSSKDQHIRWSEHFAGPLLQEAMTRGAKSTVEYSPDLQVFETGASPYRIMRTFQHCRGPLRQLALQVSMLAVFNYFTGSQPGPHHQQMHLDRSFGNPPPEAMHALTEEVKVVHRLSTWGELFTKVQYENGKAWNEDELSAALRQCMLLSEQRGYHTNQHRHGDARSRLAQIRERKERDWTRDHARRVRNQR